MMILNQYHVKKKKNDYVIELVFTGHMPKCGVSFFLQFFMKGTVQTWLCTFCGYYFMKKTITLGA